MSEGEVTPEPVDVEDSETEPLKSSEDDLGLCGLSDNEVNESRRIHGWNEVVIQEEPWYLVLLACFLQPMSLMLIFAMIISGSAEEWSDFTIITTMLMVNSLLGFFEDMKAKSSVRALKSKLVNHVDTIRWVQGTWQYTPLNPREIVVGDIIHVRGGDAIPADCSFHSGSTVEINTAALTGESLPEKFDEDGPLVQQGDGKAVHKRILGGCLVHKSPGTLLRVETIGDKTVMGQAQSMIANTESNTTSEFEKKILDVTMYIIAFTLLDVAIVMFVQIEIRGYGFWDEITDCLSLIIASVPVALPMVIQITTALGATAMSEHHAVVTNFAALQDISAMTVLCSDKTGTLTTANLTADFSRIKCYNGFTPAQVVTFASVACGSSTEDPVDKSVRISYAQNIPEPYLTLQQWNVFHVEGFTPEVKRFVAYAKHPEEGEWKMSKGMLNKIMKTGDDGGDTWTCEGIDAIADEIRNTDAKFAQNGYKTIGVAAGQKGEDGQWKMQFAGIIPMIDPPRHDTAEVIHNLNANGIEVRMITGDHKNIAIETARQIGLPDNILSNEKIKYIENRSEDAYESFEEKGKDPVLAVTPETEELIISAGGFAQVMPVDKLMIVKVYREYRGGNIIGMTGDGVNDAPALKASNVGIAVKGATAAAQSAADIILTDDGLMPIYTAVVESRKIYSRLRSYVLYRIGATIQIVVVLSTLVFVFDKNIPALYVILLALLNDITMLTVSYDNAREMKEPVKPTIFSILILSFTVGVLMALSSILFYVIARYGNDWWNFLIFSTEFSLSDDYSSGLMYLQISLGIEVLIFNCREPKDPFYKSMPCVALMVSVLFANILVVILCANSWIVNYVSWSDILLTVVYDSLWFFIVDLAKVGVARLVDEYDLESMFETPEISFRKNGGAPASMVCDEPVGSKLRVRNDGVWSLFGQQMAGWAGSTPSCVPICPMIPDLRPKPQVSVLKRGKNSTAEDESLLG